MKAEFQYEFAHLDEIIVKFNQARHNLVGGSDLHVILDDFVFHFTPWRTEENNQGVVYLIEIFSVRSRRRFLDYFYIQLSLQDYKGPNVHKERDVFKVQLRRGETYPIILKHERRNMKELELLAHYNDLLSEIVVDVEHVGVRLIREGGSYSIMNARDGRFRLIIQGLKLMTHSLELRDSGGRILRSRERIPSTKAYENLPEGVYRVIVTLEPESPMII